MYNTKKFDNGLTLVHCGMDNVRSVAIGVYVKAGSAQESKENNGIAHFTEHLLFKGTKKRSAFQLVSEIEDIGAVINASTSKEVTNYYTSSLSEHAEQCMDILSDIFFNSTFPDDEIEKEKGVVLEEIAMCDDTPDDVCFDVVADAFYQNHPFGRPILGPSENVKRFTKEDIQSFMADFYTSDSTVISIAGGVSFEKAVSLTEKYFLNGFVNQKQNRKDIPQNVPVSSLATKFKQIEQANVVLAFPSLPLGHELEIPLAIMNIALGSSMSSRLFQKVREENGFAYSIYSYPNVYTTDGYFVIYFGSAKEKVKNALKTIKKELDVFLSEGITDNELNRAKEQLKSSFVMSRENTKGVMSAIGRSQLLRGEVVTVDQQLEKISKVTKEDVLRTSKFVFDFEKVVISYVGKKTTADLLKRLSRGRIWKQKTNLKQFFICRKSLTVTSSKTVISKTLLPNNGYKSKLLLWFQNLPNLLTKLISNGGKIQKKSIILS
ncbi:MAG: insulinase family protein [Clostridia bacterium]|nr:insulinase family protein [Clostridia bacterium]